MSSSLRPGSTRSRETGAVALAALALIWGYGWTVTKIGLDYFEPFTFAALRSVLSVACLFVLLRVLRRPVRLVAPGLTLVVGLLQTTGFVTLTMLALAHTGAGKASILTYTMPFWLLLLAWAFLGERLRGLQKPAVALAFLGLLLVVSPWRLGDALPGLLAVAGGLCWAASAVAAKELHRRHEVDVLSLTAWQMLLGTPLLLAVAAFTYVPPQWTTVSVGVLAYNVLLANGVAWALWLLALGTLSAGGAGIGTLAVPVVGVGAAWLHLGERPTSAEAAGIACIIAALAMLTLAELFRARRVRMRDAMPAATGGAAPDTISGTLSSCSGRSRSTSGTPSSPMSVAGNGSAVVPKSSSRHSASTEAHLPPPP